MNGWTVYLNGKPQPTPSTLTFSFAKQDARRLAREHPDAHIFVKDPMRRVVLEWNAP